MNSFGCGEVERESAARRVGRDADTLRDQRHEMHLDPRLGGVPDSAMGEGLRIEVGVQLAVEAGEDVSVELGSNTGRIVVSRQDSRDLLVWSGRKIGP